MPGAAEISADLARNAEAFCRSYFPNGRKVGNYWQVGNVSGDAGRSLTVRLRPNGGREAGKWTDHASGEFGDLLDLLEHRIGTHNYIELRREALSFLGRPETHAATQQTASFQAPRTSDNVEAGRKLFNSGRPFLKTDAEGYLRARGIARFGPALKFHPSAFFRDEKGELGKLPALLAGIVDRARLRGSRREGCRGSQSAGRAERH